MIWSSAVASSIDGTGAPRRAADVAVNRETISEIGRGSGADAAKSTPGKFGHPRIRRHPHHYDGQATWDPYLTPSSWHGVTTVIFGNCGVGFAPVRPGTAPYLINLMEGVEDIPGTVLAEGVSFEWESFPEYLDILAAAPKVMDIGAQMPHGVLRFYVMGDRGADHAEAPTDAEIARMGVLLEEALHAGALGLTTSRTIKHRARDGRLTPGLSAARSNLAWRGRLSRGPCVIEVNSILVRANRGSTSGSRRRAAAALGAAAAGQ